MTVNPLKGQIVFEKKIAITKRRETILFWRLSKAIRRNEQPWDVIDIRIAAYKKDMKMSDWLMDRLNELQEANKKRAAQ